VATPQRSFKTHCIVIHPVHFQSDAWKAVEKHLGERLVELRQKNDSNLAPDETARIRGRIAEIKELLGLATAKPTPEMGAPGFY
jgi:hypothetical protein